MKTLQCLIAVLTVVTWSLAGVAGRASAQGSDDERTIRALIESHSAALNKGDLAGASAVYSDDATIVTASGQVYVGRAGVDKWHAEAVSGPRPLIHTHPSDTIRVYFLRPDAAMADVESHIPRPAGADGQPSPSLKVPLFIALVKRDGLWRIAAQRQTAASPRP
jgi:uncharacterized protein (TIGR02246 family)